VRSVRSNSRVNKFFVAGGAGGVKDEVLGCWLAWGGLAAAGVPWWKGVDRSSIHVGSCRKAYQVRNDFLFFDVPEL